MEITSINVSKVTGRGNVVGFANITLDNAIGIHGVKIVKLQNGNRFIAMPSYKSNKKDKDGKDRFFDVVFPTSTEARAKLTTAILEAYDKLPELEPVAISKSQESEAGTAVFGL